MCYKESFGPKFRSGNHFLCDHFGHIDGAKWHASRRDLVTFDAPRSTPEYQLNLASDACWLLLN